MYLNILYEHRNTPILNFLIVHNILELKFDFNVIIKTRYILSPSTPSVLSFHFYSLEQYDIQTNVYNFLKVYVYQIYSFDNSFRFKQNFRTVLILWFISNL